MHTSIYTAILGLSNYPSIYLSIYPLSSPKQHFCHQTFFEKIGITEIRFKPAYNPYTEPSMEIFG